MAACEGNGGAMLAAERPAPPLPLQAVREAGRGRSSSTFTSAGTPVSASTEAKVRAGCVILRNVNGHVEMPDVEVLLISRRKHADSYTVPAGKFEEDLDGNSLEACALRETSEEAGVEGEVIADLGWFSDVTKTGLETQTRFFALSCRQVDDTWVEASERERRWFNMEETKRLLSYKPMFGILFARLEDSLRRLQGGVSSPSASPKLRSKASPKLAASRGSPKHDRCCAGEVEGCSMLPEAEQVADATATTSAHYNGTDQPQTGLFLGPDVDEEELEFTPAMSSGSLSSSTRFLVESLEGERFQFYGNQVGGHFCLVKPAPSSEIMLTPRSGRLAGDTNVRLRAESVVLKPLDEDEYNFYSCMAKECPDLRRHHMPQLYGTKALTHRQVSDLTQGPKGIDSDPGSCPSSSSRQHNFWESRQRLHHFQNYIVLEDLASSMIRPCIVDLKMGFKQRSKRHSPAKRERCKAKSKNSTSHVLGFRICGVSSDEQFYDKYWGRSISVDNLREAFRVFFCQDHCSWLAADLASRVRSLRNTVSKLLHWRFWNASLLLLHDAADHDQAICMRMIDFAHCTRVRSPTPDEEYLAALHNLEVYLQAFAEQHPYQPWIVSRLQPPPPEHVQDEEEREDEVPRKSSSVDPASALDEVGVSAADPPDKEEVAK